MALPFIFKTSVQSVQLTGVKVTNLAELEAGLRQVDGSCIYHHTHRFLRVLHFLPDFPRSDFAFWIQEALKETALAERLSAIDLREYSSIRSLRNALIEVLEKEKQGNPRWNRQVPPGLEFYFCRSVSLVLNTGHTAVDLESFISGLGQVDVGSLYYHLVESALRRDNDYPLENDFSLWLAKQLGLETEAVAVALLDPYRWDMETQRFKIIESLRKGSFRAVVDKVLEKQDETGGSEIAKSLIRRLRGLGAG